MKLLIRNLSRNTTEETLRQQFETFGPVQSCQLVLDKKSGVSKGFGFVSMPKAGDAKAAMKHLNSSSLDGNTIRVKRAEEKPAESASPDDAASE